ncbi:hypothetical protein A1O7_04575 [Cladophialophora yegresii CBS 114405]|uniref:Uncharacterized protein n=1 Tax=Cladophialophora yegresii CBS 114405 TaxID=1182544 RepID=W9VXN3_9EURO|nr:uncharacterized protein A1O7_04575 [Cladophialophora yegresii CBS 114405]EXJ60423.1 hypothetical protein A1O7_04575 [Cladophialophora yegresii CBS 114405]
MENDFVEPDFMDGYFGDGPYGPTSSAVETQDRFSFTNGIDLDPLYGEVHNGIPPGYEPYGPTDSAMTSQDQFAFSGSAQLDPTSGEVDNGIPPEPYGPIASAVTSQDQVTFTDNLEIIFNDNVLFTSTDNVQSTFSDNVQSTFSDNVQSTFSDNVQFASTDNVQFTFSDNAQFIPIDNSQFTFTENIQLDLTDDEVFNGIPPIDEPSGPNPLAFYDPFLDLFTADTSIPVDPQIQEMDNGVLREIVHTEPQGSTDSSVNPSTVPDTVQLDPDNNDDDGRAVARSELEATTTVIHSDQVDPNGDDDDCSIISRGEFEATTAVMDTAQADPGDGDDEIRIITRDEFEATPAVIAAQREALELLRSKRYDEYVLRHLPGLLNGAQLNLDWLYAGESEDGYEGEPEDTPGTEWALRDDLSYNDERELNALDLPEEPDQDAANANGTVLINREEEEMSSGVRARIDNSSNPSAETMVQDPLTRNSDVELDDALLNDGQALDSHLFRLQGISMNLLRIEEVIREDEAKNKARLEALWIDNTDVRRRGLRGGTARKNRQDHGNYVKFGETAALSAEFHQHRLDVEKQDYEGRNRQAGFSALGELLEQAHSWIREQLGICEDMIRCMNTGDIGLPSVSAKISNMNAIVFGEPEENRAGKIADIEEMLQAFADEYHFKLD